MDAARNSTADAAALAALDAAELLVRLTRMPRRPGRRVLAEIALTTCGGLGGVLAERDAGIARMLGEAAIGQLRLAREISVRVARDAVLDRPFDVRTPGVLDYLRACLASLPRESFRVVFLDAQGVWRADEELGRGTVDHAPVYVREVIWRALQLGAAAIVLCHNHPSGDPTPSSADLQITREIAEAASHVGLRVEDHLVVGFGGIASFRALGLL